MADEAVVLIETEPGRVEEAISALKQLEGVKWADAVTGPYDLIAIVEKETLDDIGDFINGKINRVPSISRSVTCIYLNWPVSYVSQVYEQS